MDSIEDSIFNKEMDEIVDRIGSLCNLLMNKSMSCVLMFSLLLEDEKLRNLVLEVNQVSWYDIVNHMSYRYPILHKSKKIKKIHDEINGL